MEIGSLPRPTQQTFNAPVAPKQSEASVPGFDAETANPVTEVDGVDLDEMEKKRLAAIHEVLARGRDTFVVSDTRFTIFKDANGQFVTRFTNLRDGSVTYVPEPEIFKKLSGGYDGFVSVNA